ncbi:c-type cytochrome, methanol metabolism-related [Limobrevibacterium gyesilva]|uniref:C-type cytochrome, methanol metabolism-related n=1 Tax=Limobrevibacterium gyesilva TaxID=2991712 RepID=A0AA41YI10_9PROT|nr:c-type cytochrome, methanol metabolism-related [Limobrevibacterium gyesilva]MCW3473259.1 c-type cytochrome, methanol metabolism-related [Limobrevibacterium gyesilva]
MPPTVTKAIFLLLLVNVAAARADGAGDPAAITSEGGKYLDKDGNPTFKIGPDGKVDYYSYAGFVRYSANCLACHGPDGLGSTYAPSLVDAMKRLSYGDFLATVAGGKRDVSTAQTLVMPGLAENKNVMCYIDAIYVYLRGRADDAIPRGRPSLHDDKPPAYAIAENECMG